MTNKTDKIVYYTILAIFTIFLTYSVYLICIK